MATETVPDDIAAAIDKMTRIAAVFADVHTAHRASVDRAYVAARAELNAAILTHLRKADETADELKAALELQTSGGA